MEFVVNDYIVLKLEHGETVMYVGGEEYNLCCSVLSNIPEDRPRFSVENPESLDLLIESRQFKSTANDEITNKISPEEKFWAYSSNLQAWNENDYNTDLLVYDASIPLLEKLIEVGNPKAKAVYKKEVLSRLKCGSYSAFWYISSEGFIKSANLTEEEVIEGALVSDEAEALKKISNNTEFKYLICGIFDDDAIRERPLYQNMLYPVLFFTVRNGHVTELEIELNRRHPRVPKEIKTMTELDFLRIWVTSKNISILPPTFENRPKRIVRTDVVKHESVRISDYFIHHLYSTNFEIGRITYSNRVKPSTNSTSSKSRFDY